MWKQGREGGEESWALSLGGGGAVVRWWSAGRER